MKTHLFPFMNVIYARSFNVRKKYVRMVTRLDILPSNTPLPNQGTHISFKFPLNIVSTLSKICLCVLF